MKRTLGDSTFESGYDVEFVINQNEQGNIYCCDHCEMPVPTAMVESQERSNELVRLCDVCSQTEAAMNVFGYSENSSTLKMIAQCTNLILEAIIKANR